MSGHLIGCVKKLKDLPTSHKLALVAFADSADDRTHIAFPGYEGVQEWACVSRGRAAELIRDLVTWGYLQHHKKGHRGQRAEYIVFPDGCCELHRAPVEEPPVDVDELAKAAGVSVAQARLMLAAIAAAAPDVQPDTETPPPPEKGSGAPDAMSVNESGALDPFATDVQESVDNPPVGDGKGPESVQRSRSNANAFTPSTNSPLPPPASRQGRCAAHPNGHANCRGCGTTPRQRAAAASKAKAEKQRAAAKAQVERDRQAAAAARAAYPKTVVTAVRAAVAPAPAPVARRSRTR